MDDRHKSNRLAWDEAAGYYQKSITEDVDFLMAGGQNFCEPEFQFLKDLDQWCTRAIHLQCAGGTDTLSLLNLGAKEVIGVDISPKMIEVAQLKTDLLGGNAKWVVSDIVELSNDFDGSADLVYTGRGAINWLMDLKQWAKVIHRLLKPDGIFYLFEGHPVTYFFSMTSSRLELDKEFEGYFADKIYESKDWPETYVGDVEELRNGNVTKFERAWPVSVVINALLDAGLSLQRFEEHSDSYWDEFPNLPESERRQFPNTFSVCMRKVC